MSRCRGIVVVVASLAILVMFDGVAVAAHGNGNGNGRGNSAGHGASQSNQGARGPNDRAKYGMCTAFLHGKGAVMGKKAQARAFAAFTKSAGLDTAGAVTSFCQGFVSSHPRFGQAGKGVQEPESTPPSTIERDDTNIGEGSTTTTAPAPTTTTPDAGSKPGNGHRPAGAGKPNANG